MSLLGPQNTFFFSFTLECMQRDRQHGMGSGTAFGIFMFLA